MSETQIIILYANLDDGSESGKKDGWISRLAYNLIHLLKKLDGNHYFTTKVSEYEIDPASYPVDPAVIIPVISKNFLQSPIFASYLEVFEKEVYNTNRNTNKDKFKFINLYKNRVNTENLPDFLNDHSNIYFYTTDSITDFVSEITFEDDPDKDHNYWMKLFDIASEIKNYHNRKDHNIEYVETLTSEMKPFGIYLAQAGIDLKIERENIEREFKRNGFHLLKLDNLERKFNDLSEEINHKLSKSYISIHLIGEDPGKLIKDRGLSIVEIENQLASEHAKRINDNPRIKHVNRFKRIIWLASRRVNLSVKQKLFIENLKKDLVHIQNAEILEIPIEELKNLVNNLVEERQYTVESGSIYETEQKKTIYFICSKNEYKYCRPIGELLKEEGYGVVYSNFEGELSQERDLHNKYLKECDGTLIYYGNNSESWVKSKLFDSVKALGMGRNKVQNPTAVIVDADKKTDLDLLIDSDKLILYRGKDFTKETLSSFLSQLNNN